jgi:hypothetical protein
MNSNNKTSPPYSGDISVATRLAVLTAADAKVPRPVLDRLAKTETEIRRLNAEQNSLSLEAVREVHGASRESSILALLDGTTPETSHKHVDTLGREFSARRETILKAKGRVFLACVGDLETVGSLLVEAVNALAARIEQSEREVASTYHAPFTQSQHLAMIRGVAVIVRNRFAGIRKHAASHAANMGSPSSLLHDLLPGAVDW